MEFNPKSFPQSKTKKLKKPTKNISMDLEEWEQSSVAKYTKVHDPFTYQNLKEAKQLLKEIPNIIKRSKQRQMEEAIRKSKKKSKKKKKRTAKKKRKKKYNKKGMKPKRKFEKEEITPFGHEKEEMSLDESYEKG